MKPELHKRDYEVIKRRLSEYTLKLKVEASLNNENVFDNYNYVDTKAAQNKVEEILKYLQKED
jgi:hypothetical protein